MRPPGLDRGPQRRALAEQVLLADEVVERARAHARRERAVERRRLGPRLLRLLGLEELVHDGQGSLRPLVRVPARSTVLREWGRLGLIGFGGPPAHVALLRELVVERRGWIDAREFEDANAACQLLPGPGLDAARDLLRAARRRAARRRCVGGLAFIVPGPGDGARDRGARARERAAGVDPRDRRGRRRRGGGRGRAGAGISLGRSSLAGRRDLRAPAYLVAGAASPPCSPGRTWCSCCSAPGCVELAWRRRARRRAARLAVRARRRGGAARAGLDGVQGRRALLRRRLRGHPADAGGRGRAPRLDDRHGVPQRGRVRAAHARAGHAHGRAGRLGGGRPRRRAARRRDRVRAVVPRDRRSAASASAGCARTGRRARSSTAPGRPPSARSSAPPCRSPPGSRSGGRSPCWRPRPCCSRCGRAPLSALAGGALAGARGRAGRRAAALDGLPSADGPAGRGDRRPRAADPLRHRQPARATSARARSG